MAILIDEHSRVLVQGITGKEGSKATKEMIDYGTTILCGVTPGKGGDLIENRPVYDSVREAVEVFPDINVSVIYVPPLSAKDSVLEAIKNGISLVVLITETVPIQDCAVMISCARKYGATLVGPSSIGIISPEKSKVGSIGGNSNIQFTQGPVGIISKSGGMCSETAMILKKAGFGTSTVVGIGGDAISGSDFCDILELFEKDDQTKVIVLFCEIGGLYEKKAAEFIKSNISKPVIAYVSGKFAQQLPQVSLGHAGAILEGKETTYESKVNYFKKNGVMVVNQHHQIIDYVKSVLEKK